MREFEFNFVKGLHRGLRSSRKNPRNEQALVECMNARVGEAGLEPFVPFADFMTLQGDSASYWDDNYILDGFVEDKTDAI